MLCCLAVQLQVLRFGVTTKDPDSRPVPQRWRDSSDQYWTVIISSDGCTAWHKGQYRRLHWVLDYLTGNTFGCQVSGTGELHLYHNGRDVGVAWEGLPTNQPLWGFVNIRGWKVQADYVIPKGGAVWCDVVCGVMFVSLYICTCYSVTSCTLHSTWLLCESDRYSSIHSIVSSSIL